MYFEVFVVMKYVFNSDGSFYYVQSKSNYVLCAIYYEPIAIRHQKYAVAGIFQTQTQDSFV